MVFTAQQVETYELTEENVEKVLDEVSAAPYPAQLAFTPPCLLLRLPAAEPGSDC